MNEDELQAAAADPATPMARLADLAQNHPELRRVIAANPSAYDDLLVWLDDQGDPAVSAVISRRWSGSASEQPSEAALISIVSESIAVPIAENTSPPAAQNVVDPLFSFAGSGLGGSVRLNIYPRFIEYEHKNYFAVVPLDKISNVTYSKNVDKVYASVSIGDIDFGCHNKQEVYAAIKSVLVTRE